MQVWFSPHGTEWEAETYEEALEAERDALVEQFDTLHDLAWSLMEYGKYDTADPSPAASALRKFLDGSNPASEPKAS